MPPANDLIANADVVGKGWRSYSGTTVDAGFSDEGAAGYDQPSVWLKLDTYILMRAPFFVRWDASYPIYGELYSCNNPNVTAADLLLGNEGDFQDSFGDGTNGGAAALDVQTDGVGNDMHFFVYISNWDFDGTEGTFDLTWCVPWSIDTNHVNPDSSTASVVGGRVKDTQYTIHDITDPGVQSTLMVEDGIESLVSTAPTDGKFYVGYKGKLGGTTSGFDGIMIGLSRNGWANGQLTAEDGWNFTTDVELRRFEYFQSPLRYGNGGSYGGDLHHQHHPLWLRSGDTIGVRLAADVYNAPGSFWPELTTATFYVPWLEWPFSGDTTLVDDAEDPAPTLPTAWTLPQLNIGGGPELFSITQRGFGEPSTEVWDLQGDFVILADGTIYAAYSEEGDLTLPRDGTLALVKWDGSNWTTLENDLWGHGFQINTHQSENVSMALSPDEDYVYIVWHEEEFSSNENYWRCKRLDTSNDSLTELGPSTGTTHYANATRKRFAASFGQGIRVKVSPAGVPWVGWCEVPTADINPPNGPNHNSNLPFLYYWDGNSWEDSGLPDPPIIRSAAPSTWWDVALVEEPLPHVDFTFCHHDGPSEYPSAIYEATFATISPHTNQNEWIYWEYNGSTWDNDLQKRANLIWSGGGVGGAGLWRDTRGDSAGTDPYNVGHWHQGMALLDDGNKPILIASLGYGASSIDYTAVCTIADDGSDFEALPFPYATQHCAIYQNGGWFPFTASGSVIDDQGRIFIDNDEGWWEAQHVISQGNIEGSGWHTISAKGNPLNWENFVNFLGSKRLRARAGRIYAMTETVNNVHGIWEYTPIVGGVVSMNWRSSDRRVSANRVLVGG